MASARGWVWWSGTAAAIALSLVGGLFARTPTPAPYTTWRQYGGSADSMQYSALTQISRKNVTQLQPAWFYAVPGDALRLAFNPIVVDEVMYVAGPNRAVVALEAATGKPLWIAPAAGAPERGIAYWESKDRTDRRLVVFTRTGLREINAKNGEPIATFGTKGFVDMTVGTDTRRLGTPSKSPPRVFANLLIVGSITGEGYGSPPGDLRAYDVITGKIVWTFHTIPRPGEYGYDTWPPDAWKYAGGANTWGDITIDEARGIVFAPTGSPTHDFYGADRVGNDLFGNCLIAIDARTGKRLWHFQTVHHDLWDYDLTAAPILLTVRHNGKKVDVVAQAGKTGFLYVFERTTGKPLWPIEERPVPKSVIPGEVSSPTQPFPTKPEAFARQRVTPEDVNPFMSPEEQEKLKQAVREAANDGLFTPANHQQSQIQLPGAWGGANWGSTAGDPATGMMFVRSLEMPSYRKMSVNTPGQGTNGQGGQGGANRQPRGPKEQQGYETYVQICAACHGPGQTPMRSPAKLGSENFRALVRQGRDQMPAFSDSMISAEKVDALEAFLVSLPVIDPEQGADDPILRLPPDPNRYQGPPVRYSGSFSAGWYTSNGLPAIGPPWSQLVAYDLNEGVVKWRVPDGLSPGLAEKGITGTGSVRPRNGPVVTAGGLVFVASSQDRRLRAYDKDTGAVLWEHELDANPEGIPAVYQVNGREYIAFAAGASWGTGGDPVWRNAFHRKQGKIEAQGYHVFALPTKASTSEQ